MIISDIVVGDAERQSGLLPSIMIGEGGPLHSSCKVYNENVDWFKLSHAIFRASEP